MTKKNVANRVVRRKRDNQKAKKKSTNINFFATTFQGVERVLADELRAIGATNVKQQVRGVSFDGTIETMYKANLWSRTAHRILWPIATIPCTDQDELYEGVRSINWTDHLSLDRTFAVDTVGTNDKLIHTKFTSQKVKDGVVDWFRDLLGKRPDVDIRNPDFKINARINRNQCTISWDTSGERLHRRGYRGETMGPAPLKENLAAAMLLLSGFDGSKKLIDPMCGSGTLLIEGALIAENRAPGLLGRNFALTTHPTFEMRRWANLIADAKSEIKEIDDFPIIGYDISDMAIRTVRTSAAGSGTDALIKVKRQDIGDLPKFESGMIVTNPPYGERLGEVNELVGLYKVFGKMLKTNCKGMTAHMITSSRFLAGKVGFKPSGYDELWNGPLESRLLHYDIF